jgi:dUTP pyrophosphatase
MEMLDRGDGRLRRVDVYDAEKQLESPVLLMKRLPHYAGLPKPAYATDGSAAFDLYAANIKPIWLGTLGDREVIPTGLGVKIPPGYEGQIRPRSGLALKNGITVLNSPGTIDSDYRGEVGVVLVNLSKAKFCIERGMRIAQMVISPVTKVKIEFADDLDETPRGAGGFGSTGV